MRGSKNNKSSHITLETHLHLFNQYLISQVRVFCVHLHFYAQWAWKLEVKLLNITFDHSVLNMCPETMNWSHHLQRHLNSAEMDSNLCWKLYFSFILLPLKVVMPLGMTELTFQVRTHLAAIIYAVTKCRVDEWWGDGGRQRPFSLQPFHDKQAACPWNTQTFSAQFLLTRCLWRICMSFLLICNDFGFIVAFTVSSAHLVLLFQCLINGNGKINGNGQNPNVQRRTPEEEVLMRGDTSKCAFASCFCLQHFEPLLQQLAPYLDAIFHWVPVVTEARQDALHCSFWS